MDREEFLKQRKEGLGGSDIQHLFNEAPYGCARKLWYDKTNHHVDYPVIESNVMTRGHKLEQLIRDEYAEQTGRKIRRVNRLIRHKKYEWAACNLDAEILSVDARLTGVLECKSVGRGMYYKILQEGIPSSWILQLQHYLFVTGRKFGSFAVLWADNWEFIYFDVNRDDELIDLIIKEGDKFWRKVQNGPSPDRLDPKDKRCGRCEFRNSCQGTHLLELVNGNEEEIPFDDSYDTLMKELVDLQELSDEAVRLVADKKTEIKDKLGDNVIMECTGYRMYYKPVESTRLKNAAIKKDDPEIYDKYSYKSISRPFRVKPI